MKTYIVTFTDGRKPTEIQAVLHQGCLCKEMSQLSHYKNVKVRSNPSPYDDDEPEYELKKVPQFTSVFIPYLNKKSIPADKLKKAEALKGGGKFSDYQFLGMSAMLQVGENANGITITEK